MVSAIRFFAFSDISNFARTSNGSLNNLFLNSGSFAILVKIEFRTSVSFLSKRISDQLVFILINYFVFCIDINNHQKNKIHVKRHYTASE